MRTLIASPLILNTFQITDVGLQGQHKPVQIYEDHVKNRDTRSDFSQHFLNHNKVRMFVKR